MIKTETYTSPYNGNTLCKTYSTEMKLLLQIETGLMYDWFVIDTIDRYDEYGNPYSRYTYKETEEDAELQKEEQYGYLQSN